MATEPRYAEVLAHIEEDRRHPPGPAEAEAEQAAQRAALADPDAAPPTATGLGDLV